MLNAYPLYGGSNLTLIFYGRTHFQSFLRTLLEDFSITIVKSPGQNPSDESIAHSHLLLKEIFQKRVYVGCPVDYISCLMNQICILVLYVSSCILLRLSLIYIQASPLMSFFRFVQLNLCINSSFLICMLHFPPNSFTYI